MVVICMGNIKKHLKDHRIEKYAVSLKYDVR